MKRHPLSAVLYSFLLAAQGCGTATPYVGKGPHPQVTRGAWVPPVDFAGNVLSLPFKLLLWNWQFNNHSISPQMEAALIRYIDSVSLAPFKDTLFRLNEYDPIDDLKRLLRNRHVAWPYRLVLGLPTTLLSDVLLPGRIIPSGDYYNPFTNTVHLYSDDLPIALHEAGHAHDFADFPYRGTYALVRAVPFFDLSQEWQATETAVQHLQTGGDRNMEFRAYHVLWPAYGTYVGGYLPIPLGVVPGAIIGHVWGRLKARDRRKFYERMDAALNAPNRSMPATP
jgi:hypothetical protein